MDSCILQVIMSLLSTLDTELKPCCLFGLLNLCDLQIVFAVSPRVLILICIVYQVPVPLHHFQTRRSKAVIYHIVFEVGQQHHLRYPPGHQNLNYQVFYSEYL